MQLKCFCLSVNAISSEKPPSAVYQNNNKNGVENDTGMIGEC